MTFVDQFEQLPLERLLEISRTTQRPELASTLAKDRLSLDGFARLLSPLAAEALEDLCHRSRRLTIQRFGKVIRLFAPLYVSNECINNCQYCGFSRDNPILRVTLSLDEVREEALSLKRQGFRNLLLVSGEHPKFVSSGYLSDCVSMLHHEIPSLSLEVGPMETPAYRQMTEAGAEGLVVYQETYDREVYRQMHTAGPKKDFNWRLQAPERAYQGGFRRLGIGALFGLGDWRREAIALAAHAHYLLRHCWKAQITISLPRLRPCAGGFKPLTHLSDYDLVHLVCALRLFLPDVGVVLSTREPAKLRDGLTPLGITMMSAGSHTEPGGYTGAGKENVHLTQGGRIRPLADDASEWAQQDPQVTRATGQFDIADQRSAREVAEMINRLGYEPVWKDWEACLSA